MRAAACNALQIANTLADRGTALTPTRIALMWIELTVRREPTYRFVGA
jgi:hypothetical protein